MSTKIQINQMRTFFFLNQWLLNKIISKNKRLFLPQPLLNKLVILLNNHLINKWINDCFWIQLWMEIQIIISQLHRISKTNYLQIIRTILQDNKYHSLQTNFKTNNYKTHKWFHKMLIKLFQSAVMISPIRQM